MTKCQWQPKYERNSKQIFWQLFFLLQVLVATQCCSVLFLFDPDTFFYPSNMATCDVVMLVLCPHRQIRLRISGYRPSGRSVCFIIQLLISWDFHTTTSRHFPRMVSKRTRTTVSGCSLDGNKSAWNGQTNPHPVSMRYYKENWG